jgi:hypothetical protein
MPLSASDYVADLVAHGKYHFTTEEAVAALGESISRVRAALRRLKARGEVVDPHRSFHVILPPDHRVFGCPPPTDFVPPLMQHLHEPYYVALLSAAELYGAVHGQDVFQVMARLNRKPIDCCKTRVEFEQHARIKPMVRRAARKNDRGRTHEAAFQRTRCTRPSGVAHGPR